MRFALALLTVALLAPIAAADQDLAVGPASAKTTTTDTGTCEMGSNGSSVRNANARVQLTQHESLFVDASSYCNSNAWSDGNGNFYNMTSRTFGVYAGRETDANWGPVVGASWWDMNQEGNWGSVHWCGSVASVAGVAFALGCWPEGEAPPMLPALP